MATLATLFGKFFADSAEQVEAAFTFTNRNHANRVRPFANEDILFFVKNIDNSAVVRQADPASERAGWRMIATAAAAALLLIGVLMPKGYGVLAGYQIQKLQAESTKLKADEAFLAGEEAALMSPARMATIAKQQQYIDPPEDHVVYLPGTTNVATFAAVDEKQQ